MNRDFLSNFERPRKPTDTPFEPEQFEEDRINTNETDENEYGEHEYIRNLTLVWQDGKKRFQSYNRLDSGEIDADGTAVILNFGGDTVELIGLRLMPVFESVMLHKRKTIYCDDARYNDLAEDVPIINEITISPAS